MSKIVVTIEAGNGPDLTSALESLLESLRSTGIRDAGSPGEPEVVPATGETVATPEADSKPRRGRKAKPSPVETVQAGPEESAPAPVETPTELVVSRDELREMGAQHMQLLGLGATVEVLQKFGVDKLSKLPESSYGDVFQAFKAAIEVKAKEAL